MLDGLLTQQIRNDPDMAGMLTEYGGKPAFFYQKSPQDNDRGWTKPCYPRADYNIDMSYDPERKVSGVMLINVWCSAECAAMPEDIERRLIELISGTFYTTSEQATVCAVWSRSDAFVREVPVNRGGNTAPEVFGVTLLFDLLQFPEQLTTDPDPIQGLHVWTQVNFPGMRIIGCDKTQTIWKPTDATPAIYWRFISTAIDRQSCAVTWYTGQFAAHVIAGSVTERNRWIKAIMERITIDGEILLLDGSPMFVNRVAIQHSADPLREGQLSLTGQYGVLAQQRGEYARQPLNHATATDNTLHMEVTIHGER
jgi:hypothetical protein